MGTLRDSAKEYEKKTTKNICELKEVSTEIDVQEVEREKKDGEKYNMLIIVVEGEDYRVPSTVLEQLKTMIEEKPGMTKFKVSRKGTGKEDTVYTVIPLD